MFFFPSYILYFLLVGLFPLAFVLKFDMTLTHLATSLVLFISTSFDLRIPNLGQLLAFSEQVFTVVVKTWPWTSVSRHLATTLKLLIRTNS